jgi:hypothetical protein
MLENDDILGDEFFDKEDDVGDGDSPSSDSTEETPEEIDDGLPHLVGTDYPTSYKEVIDRFLAIYSTLPRIVYDEVHAEIGQLNIDSSPTPTLQLINLKLQKIQASKDRLGEIYQDIIRCYTFKKRAVNIMTEAWGKFAEGSSQDKRKSDSAFRLSAFHMDLAQIESLYHACDHILRNLDSQSNAISRQITIIQSQLKMFDIGRGALPDFDFNKHSLNEGFESLGDSKENSVGEVVEVEGDTSTEVDASESKSAEELSF